jgi:lipopolysaccharide biosynthesis regulator YciM
MGAALVLLLVGLGAMAAGVLIGRYYVPDDRQLRRTARHSKAYMRALSHLVARDHDTVITELRNVVEENVEDVEPYFALGAIFRSRGEHERAIRVHQALALRERDKRKLRQRAMYELGLDFRAAGMPRRATRAMEEVVVQEPSHEGALRALAALYEEQARFNEAAGLWQRLGRRRGEDTSRREHHLLVAAAQTALGRDDLDSAKQLLKAAQKHEESAHFFAAAAELAAARGNHGGAKERLKQALVAEPGLAPHLLPGLIAAEQGLARESSGDRYGADDLEDEGGGETAPLAPSARRALPETSSNGPRRSTTQPLATVSNAELPVTTGSSTASAAHASTASPAPRQVADASSASRATQVGIVAASASRAVDQRPPTDESALHQVPARPAAAAAAAAADSPSSARVDATGAAAPASPHVSAPTEERAALGPAPPLEERAALGPASPLEGFQPAEPSSPSSVPSPPFEETSLVRSSSAPTAQGTPSRSPTLPGIALVPAHRPSASVADRVLAVLAEIAAQSGPRLELALIRAQLVPPADTAGRAELARELTAQFPDALAARVATARLAIASGDPAAIQAALDALVSEDGALWPPAGAVQLALRPVQAVEHAAHGDRCGTSARPAARTPRRTARRAAGGVARCIAGRFAAGCDARSRTERHRAGDRRRAAIAAGPGRRLGRERVAARRVVAVRRLSAVLGRAATSPLTTTFDGASSRWMMRCLTPTPTPASSSRHSPEDCRA